jgi:ABC-type glycerol-3-phosphate transport system substrate-binding protein
MRKAILMTLGLVLIVSAALFAGSSGETPAATPGQSRPVVIMAYFGHQSSDEFYERLHDYIEEKTGVKFVYRDVMNADDYGVQLTAAIAAQEQIDLFATNGTELQINRSRGVIQDITDAVNANGPNIKKLFDSPPGWVGIEPGAMWLSVTVGGRIWAIPGATSKDVGVVLSIRKDWRERLGFGEIDTIEVFEDYLRKVKTADLDGNGVEDTFPFNPMYGDAGLEGIASTMLYPFVGAHGWMHEWYNATYLSPDGKITPTILHPGFKAFLAKMTEWYADGLINPDVYTSTWDNDVDLVAANRVGSTASWYSDFYGGWQALRETVPEAEYEHAVLKGPNGSPAAFALNNPASPQWSYTSWAPKDIVYAGVKLQDWFAESKDNYLVQVHGVQDVDWVYEERGDITQRPKIRHISDEQYYSYGFLGFNNWNGIVMGNTDWRTVAYRNANIYLGKQQAAIPPDWFVAYDWAGTAIEKNYNDASTFINEAIANVILGRTSLSQWDAAVAEYRKMWANAFIESATAQYNAAKASAKGK